MIKLPLIEAYPTSPFVLILVDITKHNKSCNSLHDTFTFKLLFFKIKENFVAHRNGYFSIRVFVILLNRGACIMPPLQPTPKSVVFFVFFLIHVYSVEQSQVCLLLQHHDTQQ